MKKIAFIGAVLILALLLWKPETERDTLNPVKRVQAASLRPAARYTTTAVRPATQADVDVAIARIHFLADSANRRLFKVPNLTVTESIQLRRDLNETQISRARQMGLQQPVQLERQIALGSLLQLADSTKYWTLRNLNYSVPYVTPSTQLLLVEIGERFQRSLDSLAIPRFRLVITSALRTPDKQAQLRRVNRNASRIESAHEFGTTVDVSYRRYAAPIDAATVDDPAVQLAVDSVLLKTAANRGTELQAILGRVILQMQREGKLLVRMERGQPVYHMTVARPYVSPAGEQLVTALR